MSPAYRQRLFVALAARGFCFLSLLGPAAWARDDVGVLAIVIIGLIWTVALVVETLPGQVVLTTELVAAALVGSVCGLTAATTTAAMGALAISPLTGGVFRGVRAALCSLSSSTTAFVLVATVAHHGLPVEGAVAGLVWTVTGLGLGFIGASLHRTLLRTDPLAADRRARSLIRGLVHESDQLVARLDTDALAEAILGRVRETAPVTALLLQAPHEGVLTPVLLEPGALRPDLEVGTSTLADLAAREGRPVGTAHSFALPLVSDGRVVAVVSGRFRDGTSGTASHLDHLARLGTRLEGAVIQLETALLFAAFRNTATIDERHRLARELHDGVAQGLASLGYLADSLAARVAGQPGSAELAANLRQRVGDVLTEVRQALVALRADDSEGLGAGLAELVRCLRSTTTIAIHLDVDEGCRRLRPEIEAELFRIAQEAITNALRHSGATTVEVRCRVDAPTAELTVSDDGRGLTAARPDSHGLQIMRERAQLIGAGLTIDPGPLGGVVLRVCLPPAASTPRITTRRKVSA